MPSPSGLPHELRDCNSLGMAFADLKNDFVFRRIFASHPNILRGLLNDLLEREGERVIDPAGPGAAPHRRARRP